MLLRVLWALAQISCFQAYKLNLHLGGGPPNDFNAFLSLKFVHLLSLAQRHILMGWAPGALATVMSLAYVVLKITHIV